MISVFTTTLFCVYVCAGHLAPLHHLICIPPHDSPLNDDNVSIEQDAVKCNIAQKVEDRISRATAPKAVFCIMRWEDIVDKSSANIRIRRQLTAIEECELAKES